MTKKNFNKLLFQREKSNLEKIYSFCVPGGGRGGNPKRDIFFRLEVS